MKIKFYKSLKFKTILILTVLNILMFSGIYFFAKTTIIKEFQAVEDKVVKENIERLRDTYLYSLDNLSIKLSDWAAWDDTYKFILDQNSDYIKSNLSSGAISNLKISFMIYVNANGQIVAENGINNSEIKTPLPEDLKNLIYKDSYLVSHSSLDSAKKGVLKLKDGFLKFASRPIITSDGEGPIRGTLIFATYLNDKEIKTLSDVVHLPVKVLALNQELSEDHKKILDSLIEVDSDLLLYLHEDNKNIVDGYTLVKDAFGEPAFIFEIENPRDITIQGTKSTNYFLLFFCLSGIILLIFIILLIDRLLIHRILKLSAQSREIGDKNSQVKVVTEDLAKDEITLLQNNINQMIYSLQRSEHQLSQKSQFIEVVMSNMTIGVAVNKISTGETVYANEAFENIYGWKKEVLTSVDEFFNKVYPDPKFREELKKRITTDIQSGDQSRMRWDGIEITRSDGKKRYVDARNIPLSDQDLIVSTVIDSTDLMNDKNEIKKHTEELERLNSLMTGREIKMVEMKKEIEELKKKTYT